MAIISKSPSVFAWSAAGNASAVTVGGTGTTAMIFPISASAGAPAGTACVLNAPGSGRCEGKVFYISASGYVKTGASTITVTPTIFAATSLPALANQLTPGSYTTLAAPTGVSIATASTVPWFIEAELIGDSISGIIHGNMRTMINNALTGPVAISSTLTSVSFNGEPPFVAACGMTFSVSNANNLAQLDAFYLSAD